VTFVRELFSDLVERRLWPVALLLVGALVAVPVVLKKSPAGESAAKPSAAAVAPAQPAVAGEPAVQVTSGGTLGHAPLRGHAKNPFHQFYGAAKPAAATTVTSTGSSTGTGSPAPAAGGTPSGGSTPPKPSTPVYVTASIDVRFGKAGGTLRRIGDVPRLTPLPSAANPVAIFLGMRKDLRTAVFMISSDVGVHGDGTCLPDRKSCEAIELTEGGVALLDVTADDGTVTQYELDLVKVTLQQTTDKAAAQASYARASRAGRRLMRRSAATSAVMSALRYSHETGVLEPVPSAP
jgi:hypothetical protein